MPFDDLLKLMKAPSGLRVGCGENNYCYPTIIQNRFLDVFWRHWHCIIVMKESGESNRGESRIEMRNKFPTDVVSGKVDEDIVHRLGFG